MRIESLQLHGFKSFREEAFLTFPGGITAIVGPNGSGKSNIADAFRWVLGEQSLKTIRSRESTDVIFSGSPKSQKLSRAEVRVSFAMDVGSSFKPANVGSSFKLEPTIGSEEDQKNTEDQYGLINGIIESGETRIDISRKVYASGEASYQINKANARLLDIQLFLAHQNVGARNYAVIGQGMIDEVLKLSPKDRLDFFYEATGVKKYQIKLHKAQLKLTNSREHLRETSVLLNEIAPHKRYLEKQAEKYVRRKEIIDLLCKKQESYYKQVLFEVRRAFTEKQADFLELESQYRAKELEVIKKEREIQELERAPSGVLATREVDDKLFTVGRERERVSQKISEISREKEQNLEIEGNFDAAFMHRRLSEVKEQIDAINNEKQGALRFARQTKDQLLGKTSQMNLIQERLNVLKRGTSKKGICDTLKELLALSSIDEIRARIKELIFILDEDQAQALGPASTKTTLAETEQLVLEVKAEIDDLRVQERVLAEKERLAEAATQRLIEERDDIELNLARREQGNRKAAVALVFQDRIAQYQEKKSALDKEIAGLLEQKEELRRAEEKKRASLFQWQKNYSAIVEEKNHINGLLQAVKIELAQLEMRREQLTGEAREEMGDERVNMIVEHARAGNINPVSREDTRSLRAEIKQLGAEAASLGEVDDEILREYEEVKKRFDFLSGQTEDLDGAITTLTKICAKLERKITSQFGERFNHLNSSFGKFVHTLFQGGSGVLEKIALDDGEIGIEIIAEPPGKKIKHTGVLSGGERSLVGTALICAIISSNPPPFVILDEIDAALDEANTVRLVKILKELSAHTQFIIITHNRATMEIADVLYGVTMGNDGVSRIVGVKLEEYG